MSDLQRTIRDLYDGLIDYGPHLSTGWLVILALTLAV